MMLRRAGACREDIQRFAREWPRGAFVTRPNIQRAIELRLSLDWAAATLLPCSAWNIYLRLTLTVVAPWKQVAEDAFYRAWKVMEKKQTKD